VGAKVVLSCSLLTLPLCVRVFMCVLQIAMCMFESWVTRHLWLIVAEPKGYPPKALTKVNSTVCICVRACVRVCVCVGVYMRSRVCVS